MDAPERQAWDEAVERAEAASSDERVSLPSDVLIAAAALIPDSPFDRFRPGFVLGILSGLAAGALFGAALVAYFHP